MGDRTRPPNHRPGLGGSARTGKARRRSRRALRHPRALLVFVGLVHRSPGAAAAYHRGATYFRLRSDTRPLLQRRLVPPSANAARLGRRRSDPRLRQLEAAGSVRRDRESSSSSSSNAFEIDDEDDGREGFPTPPQPGPRPSRWRGLEQRKFRGEPEERAGEGHRPRVGTTVLRAGRVAVALASNIDPVSVCDLRDAAVEFGRAGLRAAPCLRRRACLKRLRVPRAVGCRDRKMANALPLPSVRQAVNDGALGWHAHLAGDCLSPRHSAARRWRAACSRARGRSARQLYCS